MHKITVFYDGKCGLCSKEIRHYKKIAPANIFDWQDITVDAHELTQAGYSLSEGFKLLHVKDQNGQFHIGVDGFILIWKQLRKWEYLAAFVSLPGVRQISGLFYKTFANWRFKRLKHCQIAYDKERN
jgi:predicted DCC family thiol-disulfide oxidoreductase YuxK